VWSVNAAARHAPAAQPAAAIVSVDDDDDADDEDDDAVQQRVLDSLVDEFVQIVNCADRQTAKHYITSNQMNVELAICAYFDDHTS